MATAFALFGLAVMAATILGGGLAFAAFVKILSWFPTEGKVVIVCTTAVVLAVWLAARSRRRRNEAITAAIANEEPRDHPRTDHGP